MVNPYPVSHLLLILLGEKWPVAQRSSLSHRGIFECPRRSPPGGDFCWVNLWMRQKNVSNNRS